jgi:hypothetical protein
MLREQVVASLMGHRGAAVPGFEPIWPIPDARIRARSMTALRPGAVAYTLEPEPARSDLTRQSSFPERVPESTSRNRRN